MWHNYVEMKRVTPNLARDFVCGNCQKMTVRGMMEQMEKLCDGVESVKEFSY